MPIAKDLSDSNLMSLEFFSRATFSDSDQTFTAITSNQSLQHSYNQARPYDSNSLIELSRENLPTLNLEYDSEIRLIQPSEKVTSSGDCQIGQVNIIGQVHTIYNEDGPTLKKIGICQEQVLLYLQAHQAQAIFVEGLWRDFPENNYSATELSEYCFYLLAKDYAKEHQPDTFGDFIKELFLDFHQGGNFSEQQKLYLGLIGAPFIYAICNPNVSLFKSISAEDDRKIPELINQYQDNQEIVHFLRFELREFLALQEAKKYLEQNPGTNISLVYGSSHDFLPQAQKVFAEKSPVIKTVKWRNLEEKLGWVNAA